MHNSWLNWLLIFSKIMIQLVALLFYFSLFKYLFLIIGSPVFAYLSEKTESIMEGREFPFSFTQLLKDIVRGIKIALRNMLWQTVYTISIFILAFCLGSIPFGLLVSRIFKSKNLAKASNDIRGNDNEGGSHGSQMAKIWPTGALTLFLDVGKGVLAVLSVRWVPCC